MRLIVNQNEFQKIRSCVINTRNSNVINNFNLVFNPDNNIPVKGVALPKSNDIVIEIAPTDAIKILNVLDTNAGTFGDMLRNEITITAIPKWINFLKTIGEAIGKLFK